MRARPPIGTWLLACMLAALVALCPRTGAAQLVRGLPISIEVRPTASFAIGDFGSENPGLGAGTGVGLAVAAHLHITSWLAAYGSYDYERFGCGPCPSLGLEDRLPEAGFGAGVEATLPFHLGPLDPWLSAGALVGRRLEVPDGGDGFASEAGTGWSLGMGVFLPLGPSLQLRPGVRYRTYSASFVVADLGFGVLGASSTLEREMDVASVALEVGLSYGF